MRFLGFLFTVLVYILSSINSQAQNFGGGLITGVSTSQVAGDMLGGFNKIGFIFGVYTDLRVKENMSLQYEITYIEKGSKNPNIHENNIAEITLSYVEMALSFKLKQKENLGFEFGLLPALLIKSAMNDYSSNIDIDPKFTNYDFGVFAGVNYHLSDNIILYTRISNSIIPVRPHISGATKGWNKGQYNTVLSFIINYRLR